jgi:hypothetical protein
MEKHSTHGSLWSWGKEKIQFCLFLKMARADDPLWIIGPLACVGVDVRLDSDSLERAKSLTHTLDFALVQTLIPDGLTKQAGDGADARKSFAQIGTEAVEIIDSGFECWFGCRGNRVSV